MSEKKKHNLLELDEIGWDDEDSDEEITGVTYQAIIADEKNTSDKGSFLALFKYVRHRHRHLDHRILRLERLAFACVVIVTFLVSALEIYRTIKPH